VPQAHSRCQNILAKAIHFSWPPDFRGRLANSTFALGKIKSDLEERMADALYPQIYFSNGGF